VIFLAIGEPDSCYLPIADAGGAASALDHVALPKGTRLYFAPPYCIGERANQELLFDPIDGRPAISVSLYHHIRDFL
jgi:hypothetical protein